MSAVLHMPNKEVSPCLQIHSWFGPAWCEWCRNFMWGLRSQGYQCTGGWAGHMPHLLTGVVIRFCGCAVICPSTPDLVQSHTSYVSTHYSFCSVIYILSG